MRKTLRYVGALLMSATLFNAQAQDSTAADKPKFSISGYIDSYYMTAFNNPISGNAVGYYNNPDPTGAAPYVGYARAFDRLTDQFALGLVQTKFTYSDKKSDLVIDLAFGPNAELGNFGNQRITSGGYTTGYYPTNANQQVLYGTGAAIKQAYFTYKATSKLSFTAGQFGTHIGYEVIDAPVNYHYSLSNLFNNGPFYHIGAKANYAFSDKFGVMVGVVNNWDAMTDWKKQKSIIAQLFISPAAGFNIYLNYIGGYGDDGFKVINNTVASTDSSFSLDPATGLAVKGPNPSTNTLSTAYPYSGAQYNRHLFDLTAGYQITEKFYLGLNAALGWYDYSIDKSYKDAIDADTSKKTEKDIYIGPGFGKYSQAWYGVAVYANYKITDWLGIGARYEHFNDSNELRYLNGVNNGLTISAPITLADGRIILKPEFRTDYGWRGTTGGGLYQKGSDQSYTQNTLGIAFIYKY